jgi:ribosome recycling factor
MSVDDAQKAAQDKMQKSIEALKHELSTIRTGRATPSILDRVQVDYFGTPTPVNALATISAPEPRLITIQPWDRQALAAIEKAIQKSDLGLNPNNDGTVIRLVIPQLNDDRRKELVKVVQKRAEEARVAVRNLRRDAVDGLRK